MTAIKRAVDFVDERTGVRAWLKELSDFSIKGGSRMAYALGSALLAVFVVQAITGGALMTGYAPSDKAAWASVHFLQYRQAAGWLVRGIHHYGAQATVIMLAVHLGQTAFFGAYRKPREVTWWSGLVLLAIVLGFALTGYLLPWDQKGYWATQVATNIAGKVPLVGGAMQRVLQGGPETGSLTLTRFYTLHVFVLPAAIALLILLHVKLFRRHGPTPPPRAESATTSEPFFPRQLFKDLFVSLIVVGIVVAIAIANHGAPLDAPADPSSDYPARPEWYFLALFQLLKYFEGPLETVVIVGAPLVMGLYLFFLPFAKSRYATVPIALGLIAAVGLTWQARHADAVDATYQKERARADERARAATRVAMDGVPPEGPLAMLARSPEVRGPELFGRHCASCHTLKTPDHKERTAPVLDGWGTEKWVLDMLHDPDGDTRFGRTPYKGEMPSMDVKGPDADATWAPMAADDMQAVARFLVHGKDARGREIVKTRCTTCHLFEGAGDDGAQGLAPELAGWGTLAWVKTQIANPSSKATYRENALDPSRKGHMPRFDADLSAADIDVLARYVLEAARGP